MSNKNPTTVNKVLLDQAQNAEHTVRHDECDIFYRTRRIDFDLIYTSDPANKLQPLIECILVECIEHHVRTTGRKLGYGAEAKKAMRSYVQALIINLLQNTRLIKSCPIHLAISLDKNDYTNKSGRGFAKQSYDYFQTICRAMSSEDLGYICEHQKGFAGFSLSGGARTRIEATEKLLDAINDAADGGDIEIKTREAQSGGVALRDAGKKGISYKDNKDTRRMLRNVHKLNKLIAKAGITIDIPDDRQEHFMSKLEAREDVENYANPYLDFTAIKLRRIFSNGCFDQGGRFYNVWWHSVPARDHNYRSHIYIDGEETVELDYSKMHPTMLYHEEGLQLEDGFDPYVPFDGASRSHGKRAWNGLLNTTQHNPRVPVDYDSSDNKDMEWSEFLDAIMEHNKPIRHRLKTGYGLYMQYMDSVIAETVMLTLHKRGIVCLPIHDSFIVQKVYKEELEEAMLNASYEVLGITLTVDTK